MKVLLDIRRFDPATDKESRIQRYELDAEPTTRLLDLLVEIKRTVDPSLGFRRSCAHGVCGSDAMRVNGTEALACKLLLQNIEGWDTKPILVEPLRNLLVERDLMVDQNPFFEKYRSVRPWLDPASEEPEGHKEYLQSPEEREAYDEATKCILCSACYSACPVPADMPGYLGPAALVQAYRFVKDSRDKGLSPRLDELDKPTGVWGCDNHYACTKVCPRGIKITKIINLLKKDITKARSNQGQEGKA